MQEQQGRLEKDMLQTLAPHHISEILPTSQPKPNQKSKYLLVDILEPFF
jgi:hypothetical protein